MDRFLTINFLVSQLCFLGLTEPAPPKTCCWVFLFQPDHNKIYCLVFCFWFGPAVPFPKETLFVLLGRFLSMYFCVFLCCLCMQKWILTRHFFVGGGGEEAIHCFVEMLSLPPVFVRMAEPSASSSNPWGSHLGMSGLDSLSV